MHREKTWERTTRQHREEDLAKINELRQKLMDSIRETMAVLKKRSKTVYEVSNALHTFFRQQNLQKKVKSYEEHFAEQGELVLAREYAQIYRIVINLLDQFVELLGDERISMKEYCELLDAGFEQAKVGTIPPGLDQVVVGDIERTRTHDVKAVFLVGVNDVYIPGNALASGLISDMDRQAFEKHQFPLKPNAKEQMYIQKFYLYLIMTKPMEYLCLTYSKMTLDGKSIRPAYVIDNIKKLFPLLVEQESAGTLADMELTKKSGVSYLIQGLQQKQNGFSDEWKEVFSWYRRNAEWDEKIEQILSAAFMEKPHDSLTKEIAEKLYGKILANSVTRLEKFVSCAYAHFLSYGLRLDQREEYHFETMDFGNLFHAALEIYSEKVKEAGYQWTTIPPEEQLVLADESVVAAIEQDKTGILTDTARTGYIITKVKRMMRRTIWALTKQLEPSDFEPSGFEVAFGKQDDISVSTIELSDGNRMELRGKIDRIDLCEDGDKVYVKIIDYKTGNKSFDISDFYHGLQLQLMTYMKAAMDLEKKKHPDKEIFPAGILYYAVKDPLVQDEKDDVSRDSSLLKELRPNGLVNASEEVIEHLHHNLQGASLAMPVDRNKDGSIAKKSKITQQEYFLEMTEYALEKAKDIGESIMGGETEILPYAKGNRTGCQYCPYLGICKFDAKIPGYDYKQFSQATEEDVLKAVRKETEA